jgi:hypothetical protein
MNRRFVALPAALGLLLQAQFAYAAYNPSPTTVVGGGTGLATLTAHAVLVGEGTGNVALVGPGATAGVALVSGGASADPSFTTLLPVGGGTGLATLTAHNILLGEGTSNVAFAAPGATVGVPLISQNATTDPIFGTAVVAGGGTGATTLAANGVLVGEGTSAIHVVGTSSTADSVVAWAAAGSDPAALSIGSCSTGSSALTYNTSTHVFGCNSITAGAAPTTAIVTGGSPFTLTATNLLTTIVSMATPAASTVNLPTAVQASGFRLCVKDGTTNFATNNATVKSPTSGTIDGVAGATGIVMNQTHQELCFISDTTNWNIE